MKVNSALSAEANIHAQIKETNPGANPSSTNVLLGVPMVGSFDGKNTSIDISAIKNKGYSGARTVFYDRQTLANARKPGLLLNHIALGVPTLAVLRSQICARFGLVESELDWTAGNVPNGGASTTFTMSAKVGNLLYVPGSTLSVLVTHASALMEVVITAGNTNSVDLGNGYWNRGHLGWTSLTSLSLATGSVSGSVDAGSGNTLTTISTLKYIPGADASDIFTPYFSVNIKKPTDPQLNNKNMLKKMEIFLEDTAGQPLWYERMVDSGVLFTQGADGFSGNFPSRWDFPKSGPSFVAGTRYRVKIYRI